MSGPPEQLLTWMALLIVVTTVVSGAVVTLLAQWRLRKSFWRGLFQASLVSLFCLGALAAIDVLIGHSSPISLF